MSELDRFNRIVAESGLEYAIKWEREAAERYHKAYILAALNERTGIARGPEWAQKYCEASRECSRVSDEAAIK